MSYHQVQQNAQSAAAAGPGTSSAGPQEEFTVRIPRDNRKRFTMMKFRSGASIDFSKLGEQSAKLERENNLKEYKTANDLDLLPKFGAGSEYGRDQKEESRRKKYGIMLKKYNPEDQPWILKIGSGKQAKRYKGVREGTISANTSYFIFTKASDGAFEAYPVEQWYNFSPTIRYKYLNSEEAEEEYSRRDKTLNYFSIMVKNKLKKEDDNADDEEAESKKKGGKSKKKSDMILTDMEEWDAMQLSDDDDSDDDEDKDGKSESAKSKKKKQKPGAKGKKKRSKQNSDDEAMEDSDEGDYDDREVDYMSDSGSDSSLSGPEADTKEKKYDEKGVDEEAGLRNILDSGDEEEEEEAEKEEIEEEAEKEGKTEEKKKGADESSSSSSDDDSDIEKEAKLASELLFQDQKQEKGGKSESSTSDSTGKTESGSGSAVDKNKAGKRKAEKTPDGKSPLMKKHKSDDSDGITEDAVRRYLMRKPMTTKDLFQKFKSKKLNMSNDKISHIIARLLKKINPERTFINKKLYLSLKKPE